MRRWDPFLYAVGWSLFMVIAASAGWVHRLEAEQSCVDVLFLAVVLAMFWRKT